MSAFGLLVAIVTLAILLGAVSWEHGYRSGREHQRHDHQQFRRTIERARARE